MKLRKLFIGMLLVALIGSPQVKVMASGSQLADNVSGSAQITPFGEVTEWCYRKVDGKLQKRLWSRTYGVWRTNWMWV